MNSAIYNFKRDKYKVCVYVLGNDGVLFGSFSCSTPNISHSCITFEMDSSFHLPPAFYVNIEINIAFFIYNAIFGFTTKSTRCVHSRTPLLNWHLDEFLELAHVIFPIFRNGSWLANTCSHLFLWFNNYIQDLLGLLHIESYQTVTNYQKKKKYYMFN